MGLNQNAQTVVLTALALVAFAANSIFCRLALGWAHADPASFTAMRLLSGALMLAFLGGIRGCRRPLRSGSWRPSLWLFLYASAFSFAYGGLTAGTGALILFATVQVTMLSSASLGGGRPGYELIVGIVIALAGIGYLLSPSLSAPPPMSALLMVVAGLSWGIYSLLGRSEVDPLAATTGNFVRAAGLSLVAVPVIGPGIAISTAGLVWAVASGALASALGYTVWYAALRVLSANHAATVQLFVPVLAALGGTVLLAEELTPRLITAALVTLFGIAVSLRAPVQPR